jgi:hypothetical protein
MKNSQSDTLLNSGFFTEEAAGTFGIAEGGGLTAERPPELKFEKTSSLPMLPATSPADTDDGRKYERTLRAFFRSGKGGGLPAEGSGAVYPALLAPFRDHPHMERNYPLWMGADGSGQTMALHDFLTQRILLFAPGQDEAKILKDNLLRLEVIVREQVKFAEEAYQGLAVLTEALEELKTQLHLTGKDAEAFAADVENLKKQIPREGLLLPFSPNAPFYLLAALKGEHLRERRDALREKIRHIAAQLNDILAVEQSKTPEAKSPEKLHDSLDFAESFFKFEEMSSVLPVGGASVMPAERLQRIEKVVQILETVEADFFQKGASIILGKQLAESTGPDWKKAFDHSEIIVAGASQACKRAMAVFDKKMAAYAEIFAAIRTGELEIDNVYASEIHGDYLANFSWRSFTEEEMAVCPPVLLFAIDSGLMENELNEFSKMLSSSRPVKCLIVKQGGGTAADFVFRQELGAIAIAHRNTFILQSAAIAPAKLVKGFRSGLDCFAPALFYILCPQKEAGDMGSAHLWASAAVESREFPGFVYDSRKDSKWGSRFDILHNPQPDADWPEHTLHYQDENGEESSLQVPFTFADYAAQDPQYAALFHIVPPQFWSDNLMPIGEYLTLPPEELYTKVPFVWVVDAQNQLQKAAAAWPLVLTCRERLDFWHFLQENAGIHSYHVEQATGRLRQEMEAETAKKTAQLEAAHAAALDQAKEEEGRIAMERLAAVLLDMDTAELVSSAPATAKPPPAAPAQKAEQPAGTPTEPAPPTAAEVEEESLVIGEPWIESVLCTTCNECTNLNKRMFQYNASKQAFLADPKAGTFRELVMAAEECPVGIIHPGLPINKEEPGLEELIKRAEPFN